MKTIMWFGFVLGALSAAGKVFQTKLGQEATIKCTFNTREWQHGSTMIHRIIGKYGVFSKGHGDIAGRSIVKQEKNLVISKVKEEDAGKFTCAADGKSEDHTLLVVSVSASPSGVLELGSEATLQCQVKGLNPGTTVQWQRPDGSPQTGSEAVQLKPVANSDAGTWKCTFSYGGETYNETLDVKIKEPAPVTPGPFPSKISKPTCSNCVTDRPSDAALLLGLSLWVWVAVVVGSLVVVLLMVLVIVLCKRVRRRKRKLLKMKNGRQLLKTKEYCQCGRPAAAAKPQQGRRREKPSALPLQPSLTE